MAKHEGGFFWGVLLGAIAAAIAGCVALSRSFRGTPVSNGSPAKAPRSARPPKTGARRQVSRSKKAKKV